MEGRIPFELFYAEWRQDQGARMLGIDCKPPNHVGRFRKGVATVELAVCLPFMVAVALGSIEATNAIFLQQRLTSAAYEGARKATAPGKTTAMATAAATDALTQFGVVGGSVTITPGVTISTTTGTQVTVRVTAPLSSNSGMQPFIIGKIIGTMAATVVMIHQ